MIRYLLVLFLFSPLFLHAQCKAKAEKLYLKAKENIALQPSQAIANLKQAIDICPDYEAAVFLLADLYKQRKDDEAVVRELERYIASNQPKDKRVYYFLAEAQASTLRLEKAIANYTKFLNSNPKSKKMVQKAQSRLELMTFRKSVYDQPDIVEFDPFDEINSDQSEYLPIVTADDSLMIFTRRRNGIEDAFFMKRMSSGAWTAPIPLTDLPEAFRKAAVSISADGNLLVFAMADDPKGQGSFDLYSMERKNGAWSHPKNLGAPVNTPGWESQPCLSSDGRTLYFTSDRKGGEGGYDIWKTKRDIFGGWTKPTNLGPEINSPMHEESPFIHRDQRTLYFRSNGHNGLGSYDIFMSQIIRFKKWVEPVHLGYPINSIGNDGSFFVSMDGRTAFVASDVDRRATGTWDTQKKAGDIDVYAFELAEKYRPQPTAFVKIHFVDADSGTPLAPVIALQREGAPDTLFYDRQSSTTLCIPTNASYALAATLQDYQPHFERFSPEETSWDEMPHEMRIALHKIPVDKTVEPTPIVLENVLFETNSDALLPSSAHDLQTLYAFMKANPTVRIEIQGHTDDVGEEADNMDLSTRRANQVKTYLENLGISASRLEARGYGESQPIASNNTEAGRALNRRTAFVIK